MGSKARISLLMSAILTGSPHPRRNGQLEPLENGESLTAPEFMRRYEAMKDVKKVELIEGTVYMPSPVRFSVHSLPDSLIQTWLGTYCADTPGTQAGANGTVRLDLENVPQPDAALRITEECGGSSHLDRKGYLTGPPELVVEIAASSSSIDLHDKLRAYRRNGIKEYLVWRTTQGAFDWFVLGEGEYEPQLPDAKGICLSVTFPGLLLNIPALLDLNGAAVLATLRHGLKSRAHKLFVNELRSRKAGK